MRSLLLVLCLSGLVGLTTFSLWVVQRASAKANNDTTQPCTLVNKTYVRHECCVGVELQLWVRLKTNNGVFEEEHRACGAFSASAVPSSPAWSECSCASSSSSPSACAHLWQPNAQLWDALSTGTCYRCTTAQEPKERTTVLVWVDNKIFGNGSSNDYNDYNDDANPKLKAGLSALFFALTWFVGVLVMHYLFKRAFADATTDAADESTTLITIASIAEYGSEVDTE